MSVVQELSSRIAQLTAEMQGRKAAAELLKLGEIAAGLERTIDALNEEVTTLRAEVERLSYTAYCDQQLSQEEEAILQLLAHRPQADAQQIAEAVSLDLVKTEYWIGVLADNDMISFSLIMDQPINYYLIQDGRKYVVKNKLA